MNFRKLFLSGAMDQEWKGLSGKHVVQTNPACIDDALKDKLAADKDRNQLRAEYGLLFYNRFRSRQYE